MNFLAHVADRVIGRPLLLHPQKLEVISYVLAERIGLARDSDLEATLEANAFFGKRSSNGTYRVANRKAIIPVHGTLVNRGAWIGPQSGMTSYEGMSAQLRMALDDADVDEIVLDMDSPGGEVAGFVSFASEVAAARTRKPITAYVNDMAASAAYGIASQATEIVSSPTSVLGSIGVVMMHVDHSKELEKKGRVVTYIYAGDHKVDGNPAEPLPDNVRASFQAEVDSAYQQFVGMVGSGRGDRLNADAARATQAQIFTGEAAVTAGLSDRIGTLDSVLTRARQGAGMPARARAQTPKRTEMDENTIDMAQHEQAVAKAKADGRKEGASEAVSRIKAILSLDEAQGREAQAQAIAFDTDLPAEQAKAILSAGIASPATTAAAPTLRPDAMAPAAATIAAQPPVAADASVVNFDAKASLKKHADKHNAKFNKA